jgi:hypothetical protein
MCRRRNDSEMRVCGDVYVSYAPLAYGRNNMTGGRLVSAKAIDGKLLHRSTPRRGCNQFPLGGVSFRLGPWPK